MLASLVALGGCSSPQPRPSEEPLAARTSAPPSGERKAVVGLARPQRPDRTRLVVFQSRQLPAALNPINVYVNTEYQATSLGHTYTVVDVCTGPSRLGTAVGDANQAYKSKPVTGEILDLMPGTTQYLQLITDVAGQRLVPVSQDVGRQEIAGLPLQAHTLSRVDPNKCASLPDPLPAVSPSAPPVVAQTVPQPVQRPAAIVASYRLSAQSLFAFNRSDAASILPEGRKRLKEIAADILAKTAAGGIKVVGHTDPLGTDAYNMRLSQARAQTVADELVRAGVPVQRIAAEGRGKRELIKTGCTGTRPQKIICYQPNRRVDIDVLAPVTP